MDPSDHRRTRTSVLGDLLDSLDDTLRTGDVTDLATTPTGFEVLDDTIGGGLHAGDLMLLAGPPAVGKTIAALQMARTVARDGGRAIYVCYEHEEIALATRLLALEAATDDGASGPASRIAQMLLSGARTRRGLVETLAEDPVIAEALARLRAYADRLVLVRASGTHTGLAEIEALLVENAQDESRPAVFIDYLQKVAVTPTPEHELEKITRTVEGLKDLALSHHVPVVAVSAVDAGGLATRRLRLHHLRGSDAAAFEADIVVMMNDKVKAVSKVHLAYDSLGAHRFREWVVFSLEKNRGGPNLVDLEFRKDFAHFRFHPEGGVVTEKLSDERVLEELA